MPFSRLGLSPYVLPALQRALQQAGYGTPTPIQQQAVPVLLKGQDVVALAPTGSGKTAAYVLPALQHFSMAPPRRPRVLRHLVLVPTRELALQVADVFATLGRELPRQPRVVCAVGGVSINPQMMALRGGADVVVATPGRLLDLLAHNALSLRQVQLLVLDEADRLLELGFGEELRQILAELPAQRQTALFSATFPEQIEALAAAGLRAPQRLQVDAQAQPEIEQRALRVDAGRRVELLLSLLDDPQWRQVLVFVGSIREGDRLAGALRRSGIAVQALHGDLSQGRRVRTLQAFKDGELQVLVATDVAARGIDIAGLPVVVNHELPRSPADYLHRIGRTGRAGAAGLAVSFVEAAALAHWRLICRRHGLRLEPEVVPGFEPQEEAPAASPVADGNGGIKGRRPSKKDRLRAAARAESS
ncbi:MAG: DEAD/DEAH box helicase [Stenotrophomonas nitritireducens]|uniref:DEAD/DEAH box helicase n=1 Tax=Stenotrophomonas nitritireducens TaxID=83617 RepID=UPI001AC3F54A|nr:DEAD/DEAH box helicase [Stenotrophomonas nitritireducens]MBN8793692.1 DEAD/DEAH box helicase [Stenotrophomonas nitritireducens]MBN8797409.1 DEAD/DEAH box helicase [Stenotrophomonas nitritireducens]